MTSLKKVSKQEKQQHFEVMISLGAHFLKKNTKLNPKAIMCVHFKTCCISLAGTQINNPINHFCDIKGFIPSVLIGMAF